MKDKKVNQLLKSHPDCHVIYGMVDGLVYFYGEDDPGLIGVAGESGMTILTTNQAKTLAKEIILMLEEVNVQRSKAKLARKSEERRAAQKQASGGEYCPTFSELMMTRGGGFDV